jgi:hypothetical protein
MQEHGMALYGCHAWLVDEVNEGLWSAANIVNGQENLLRNSKVFWNSQIPVFLVLTVFEAQLAPSPP